jgi:hypothetical protein
MTRVSRAEAAETLREQCLRPVDEREGSYPPDHLQALEQDRRANADREGTTRAHRSSWSRNRVGAENLVTSRDLHVFVYQAAEPVSS